MLFVLLNVYENLRYVVYVVFNYCNICYVNLNNSNVGSDSIYVTENFFRLS